MSTNLITQAINKKVTRRSFLKWSAALGATASVSGLVLQNAAKKVGASIHTHPIEPVTTSKVVDWRPSCCLVCHGWCAIAVGVDNQGYPRKIEGMGGQPKKYVTVDAAGVFTGSTATNVRSCQVGPALSAVANQEKADDAAHIATPPGYLPFAPHNKGRICAKGSDGVEHLYDADRIKTPLERVGDRGGGKWRRVTWAYALKKMANVLRELAGFDRFYDLDDDSDLALYAQSAVNTGLTVTARRKDLRHRCVLWIGRNENPTPGRFAKTYGIINHIEHTSICELSRHVAGRFMWGHHWSSPDHETHTPGHVQGTPGVNGRGWLADSYTFQDDNDCDFYLEWGGNPAEQKIPHTSCNNHMADRRRKNLQGYSYLADDPAGKPLNDRKGRIVCIDVRQSNTAAYADEYFQIHAGEDGALALGMIYYLMAVDPLSGTLRNELDRGHMGNDGGLTIGAGGDPTTRRYYGLFKSEEDAVSGGGTSAVPANKSLEHYLVDGEFAADLGVANTVAAVLGGVAAKSGIAVADIVYLARAVGGLRVDGGYDALSSTLWTTGATARRFANAVVDCYRGPVKHSNGVYNGLAVRTLQVLAANQSACHFWGNRAVPVDARGGFNAPGGFTSDKNWKPYNLGGGIPSGGGAYGGKTDAGFSATILADTGVGADPADPFDKQRIDNWDYDYDMPRWRGSYKWVDQHLQAGIRFSLGLYPYGSDESAFGAPGSGSKGAGNYNGPFGSKVRGPYAGVTADQSDGYRVEVLINHKNAPTYARANSKGETAIFRARDDQGSYRLKHIWSIDLNMGDGTRFADLILPDASYLERWSERSGEGQEFNYRDNFFFRQPVYEYTNASGMPRHMYDSRQVKAIFYELARYVAHDSVTGAHPADGTAPASGQNGWSQLYTSWDWVAGDMGNIATCPATVNDGEYAVYQAMISGLNGALGGLFGAIGGYVGARSHGMLWNSDDGLACWRDEYTGVDVKPDVGLDIYAPNNGYKPGSLIRRKLTVYNPVLDTMPDLAAGLVVNSGLRTFATKADGTFFGTARYVAPIQQTSSTYPLNLTTYKVNVHTQSRTATCPRLNEIIGWSWVMIHPDTADGTNPANPSLAANPIKNGDKVKIITEIGEIIGDAKVTPKAQVGHVHVSHSQGHRQGINSFDNSDDTSEVMTRTYNDAFGKYLIQDGFDWKENRSLDTNPMVNEYRQYLPPSAPGKGIHPNPVIQLHVSGSAYSGANGGKNIATDPIGGSMAWYDTKCRIEKG